MRLPIPIKTLLISLVAFALSAVMMAPLGTSVGAIFSTPEKNDFTLTDFYNMLADSRAVAHMDDHVVIVNIDDCDRNDIANLLDMATICGAAAVGLDVMFIDPRPGDEPLLEALARTPNLLQPLTLEPEEAHPDTFCLIEHSYFFDPAHPQGYVSSGMPSKYTNSMIREFRPDFYLRGVGHVPGMAMGLAKIIDPEAAERITGRGHELENITFHSRRFRVYEPDELVDFANELTGRIVLLGAMNERSDVHQTPVNSQMPGIMIHAHALATILDGQFMRVPPKWILQLASFLLCYFFIYLVLTMTGKTKGLRMRLIQVLTVIVLVQTGYWLFLRHSVVIDFSSALLMVVFGSFAIDIWTGCDGILDWLRNNRLTRKLTKLIKPTI